LGDKKKREKDDILDAIIEEYPVERLVQKQDGKGRPKIIHRMMVE
jgi:rRNA pseudouridine-1189 N-methylase Emg1 (Nep1/Mra1 family)